MVDQRRLADAAPRDEAEDVCVAVGPRRVEPSQMFVAPEQVAASHGKAADGDFRCGAACGASNRSGPGPSRGDGVSAKEIEQQTNLFGDGGEFRFYLVLTPAGERLAVLRSQLHPSHPLDGLPV